MKISHLVQLIDKYNRLQKLIGVRKNERVMLPQYTEALTKEIEELEAEQEKLVIN